MHGLQAKIMVLKLIRYETLGNNLTSPQSCILYGIMMRTKLYIEDQLISSFFHPASNFLLYPLWNLFCISLMSTLFFRCRMLWKMKVWRGEQENGAGLSRNTWRGGAAESPTWESSLLFSSASLLHLLFADSTILLLIPINGFPITNLHASWKFLSRNWLVLFYFLLLIQG